MLCLKTILIFEMLENNQGAIRCFLLLIVIQFQKNPHTDVIIWQRPEHLWRVWINLNLSIDSD